VSSSLDSLSDFAVVLQRSSGQAARQNLPLFVQEFLEELRVLVVNIFNAASEEAAIFFLLYFNCQWSQVSDF
jgi:hypothetical protein